MTDLSEFLLARIAEDEVAARHVLRFTHENSEHYHRPGASFDQWSVRRDEEDLIVEARLGALRPIAVLSTHYLNGDMADHIARWDPARVLAECKAKRRTVEQLHVRAVQRGGDTEGAFDAVLRLLALPYADHPDYRQEVWRP